MGVGIVRTCRCLGCSGIGALRRGARMRCTRLVRKRGCCVVDHRLSSLWLPPEVSSGAAGGWAAALGWGGERQARLALCARASISGFQVRVTLLAAAGGHRRNGGPARGGVGGAAGGGRRARLACAQGRRGRPHDGTDHRGCRRRAHGRGRAARAAAASAGGCGWRLPSAGRAGRPRQRSSAAGLFPSCRRR